LSAIYKKTLMGVVAILGIAWSSSAFALAPCSSIANLGELLQAGTCYLSTAVGSKVAVDDVTISNVQTNIPPSAYSLVGVSIGVDSSSRDLARVEFNTDGLSGNSAYAQTFISLEAQCDGSCLFNGSVVTVQGFPGSGVIVINDSTKQFNIPTSNNYTYYFAKNVGNVKASVNVTQTQIPGKAEGLFTFFFRTVQTGSSGLPSQCVAAAPKTTW
jgi:hypothetical protein